MSTVFRVQKNANYTTMSNYHLKDRRLSYKAKGLLSVILSLPDEWDYSLKGLAYISGDGIDSVRGGIRELENFGYISRGEQTRDELGRMSSNEYFVYENPDQNPYFQPPTTGNPISDTNSKSKNNSEVNEEFKTENTVVKPNSTALENPTRLDSQTSDVATALDFPSSENPLTDNPSTENPTTGTLLNNKILTNQVLNNQSIHQSSDAPQKETNTNDMTDMTDGGEKSSVFSFSALTDLQRNILENIEYESIAEKEKADELVGIMLDVLCTQKDTVRVNSEDIPKEMVRERFLKLHKRHIEYVLTLLKNNKGGIRNIRAYIITLLYNAPVTIGNYNASKRGDSSFDVDEIMSKIMAKYQ